MTVEHWSNTENPDEGWHLVWETRLDDRYDIRVVSWDGNWYQGRLQIKDGEKILLDEAVTVAYGAPFGPDVDDVAAWESRILEVVDGQ